MTDQPTEPVPSEQPAEDYPGDGHDTADEVVGEGDLEADED